MLTKINVNGEREKVSSSPFEQGYKMIPCHVEVDQSFSIRTIYDRWKRGKPTSVHPFNCEFDENADDIDFDLENPIDPCQVENNVSNLQDQVNSEKAEAKKRKKRKEDYRRERDEFIEKLTQKLPFKE